MITFFATDPLVGILFEVLRIVKVILAWKKLEGAWLVTLND